MKYLGTLILTILLIFSAGCIRSLHPLYTDQDVIFDPDLVGCWSDEGSKEKWDFSKQDEKQYRLVYSDDKGISGTFVVHLLKIDGNMFMDLYPDDPGLKLNDFYQWHLLGVHNFIYVKQIMPTLQMSFPEMDWLEDLIEANPEAIRHEMIDDDVVLTASTMELQAFWLKHLDTEAAFADPSNMKREKTTCSEEAD
ncbi:hypothetical protein ACFLQJ_03245, partial [Calditrichota bacterium]